MGKAPDMSAKQGRERERLSERKGKQAAGGK
jgi:hypothetical protein